jgi:hypothetical protein
MQEYGIEHISRRLQLTQADAVDDAFSLKAQGFLAMDGGTVCLAAVEPLIRLMLLANLGQRLTETGEPEYLYAQENSSKFLARMTGTGGLLLPAGAATAGD